MLTDVKSLVASPPRTAQRVTVQRLLNAFLRETGAGDPRIAADVPQFELQLPSSGRVLLGTLTYWSVFGHHVYVEEFWLSEGGAAPRVCGHTELVETLLSELEGGSADAQDRREKLAAQIDNSVRRTARYLARDRPHWPSDPAALTRYTEQSLLTGHPFHPTPKSAEGFSDDDLAAYAPELGATFGLHYFAAAPEVLLEERVAPGPWTPDEVLAQVSREHRDFTLMPVHPWQAGYLLRQPAMRDLVAAGKVVSLGPLGRPVFPTSSVRTVCDPGFGTAWKLPLHVRITNFIRNNPVEHAQRAAEASRLIASLRESWVHEGFEVLLETGFRTLDHPVLAEDITVLYRENPFPERNEAPQVVAGLLDERPDEEPDLIRHVREAGPLTEHHVAEWLRGYLAISLLPILAVWRRDGISLEAHVQNSLVHFDGGWPARFSVRDMEGTSASRERLASNGMLDSLPEASPLVYDDAEAWMRLKYYVITNHLGHLIHVLARFGGADERLLWRVVRQMLHVALPDRYVLDLLNSPTLPAKANLISRFAERGERPLYVTVANPMHEVSG